MLVERPVHVVEAEPEPAERLEARAVERGEDVGRSEADRVFGEEKRPRLEDRDDLVAREDAGDGPLDLVTAADEEAVPTGRIGGVRVLAPVGRLEHALVDLTPGCVV